MVILVLNNFLSEATLNKLMERSTNTIVYNSNKLIKHLLLRNILHLKKYIFLELRDRGTKSSPSLKKGACHVVDSGGAQDFH